MAPTAPKPADQTGPEPRATEPAAPSTPPDPTQPEKPFETAEDRAVAERTAPDDLEFTTPAPPSPPEK